MRLLTLVGLLAGADAFPSRLTANQCAKAITIATGTISPMMQTTATLGPALTVSRAGVAIVDGGTYTPGETLTVTPAGTGQYAFYATLGTFANALGCGGKLAGTPAATATLTTPIGGGILTIGAARANGQTGALTYQRITLTADGGDPPVGGSPLPPTPPGAIGVITPPPSLSPPEGGRQYRSADGSILLEWEPAISSTRVTVRGTGTGWVGFALSSDGSMLNGGANLAVVGLPALVGGGTVTAYVMQSKTRGGMVLAAPVPIACGVDTSTATLTSVNGVTEMSFVLRHHTGDAAGTCIAGGVTVPSMTIRESLPPTGVILARGNAPAYGIHASRDAALALSADGSGIGGLSIPVSSRKYLHGLMMTVAWVILAPLGVYVARFERAREPKGWWFRLHRGLLVASVVLTAVGFVLALTMVEGSHFYSMHSKLGLLFSLALVIQPTNAYFRPKHGDSSRATWETAHKLLGASLLLGGVVVCLLGAQLIGAQALVPTILLALVVYGGGFYHVRNNRSGGIPSSVRRPSKKLSQSDAVDLPMDWVQAVDPATGRPYFQDTKTGHTQWEKPATRAPPQLPPPAPPMPPPAELPSPWQEMFDEASKHVYYYNSNTGETTWTKPTGLVKTAI